VHATTTRPKVTVTADGEGVVSHAGSRLLADVADRTTLTAQFAEALAGLRRPRLVMIQVGCWSIWRWRWRWRTVRPRSPTWRC
jgi:hypothetical protein